MADPESGEYFVSIAEAWGTISADPIGHFGRYYNACNSGRQSKRDKISHFFGLPEVIHLKQQSVFKLCSYGVNEIFSISFVFMDPLS